MMYFKTAFALAALTTCSLAAAQVSGDASAGASANASVGAGAGAGTGARLGAGAAGGASSAAGLAGSVNGAIRGTAQAGAGRNSATENLLAGSGGEQQLARLSAAGFSRLDVDGNQLISEQEAIGNAVVAESMVSYDLDADGALSADEFDALTTDLRSRWQARQAAAADAATQASESSRAAFVALDQNGDGVIVGHEAAASSQTLMQYETIDGNDDGLLSEAEFAAFVESGAEGSATASSGQ